MVYRPTWQGHLKLSLVTCPVSPYTATDAAGDVHFHLINPKINNRIKMITTDPESGPIDRQNLVIPTSANFDSSKISVVGIARRVGRRRRAKQRLIPTRVDPFFMGQLLCGLV